MKNEKEISKDKIEFDLSKTKELLLKLSTEQSKEYFKDLSVDIFTIPAEQYSKYKLSDKQNYIWNKLTSETNIDPVFKPLILILTENLKSTLFTLGILEEIVKIIIQYQNLFYKYEKAKEQIEVLCSIDPNYDKYTPRFSINELDDIIYHEFDSISGNYIKQFNKTISDSIIRENKDILNDIRTKYDEKLNKIRSNLKKNAANTILSMKNEYIRQEIESPIKLITKILRKIKSCAYKSRIYKIIGLTKQASKKLYKLKFLGIKNNNNKSENNLINNQEITNQISELRIQQIIANTDESYQNIEKKNLETFNNNIIRNKVLKSEEEYNKFIEKTSYQNDGNNIHNINYNIDNIDTPTLNRVHKLSKDNKQNMNGVYEEEEDDLPELDPHNIFNRKK